MRKQICWIMMVLWLFMRIDTVFANPNNSRVDYFVMFRGGLKICKVESRNGRGKLIEIKDETLMRDPLLSPEFAVSPDFKDIYYSDSVGDEIHLFHYDFLARKGTDVTAAFNYPECFSRLSYSNSGLLAVEDSDRILLYGNNKVIKSIDVEDILKKYKEDSIYKLSWNATSDKLCISTRSNHIYLADMEGNVNFLCDGMAGTFSPVNPAELVVINPNQKKLRILTIDATGVILKDKTLSGFFMGGLYGQNLLMWSMDGKAVYYTASRLFPFSLSKMLCELSNLECVDIKTHKITKIDAESANWNRSNAPIHPIPGE